MGEHDKLRAVIADARIWTTPGERHGVATDRLGEWLNILADAAESTLPKTKMVEVWHVEFAQPHGTEWLALLHTFRDEATAKRRAATWADDYKGARCIRVTGPHQQEVPA